MNPLTGNDENDGLHEDRAFATLFAVNRLALAPGDTVLLRRGCRFEKQFLQLQCSGTAAVLELMEHGYPSRAHFNDLHALYSTYLPPKLQNLSPKTFCEVTFEFDFIHPVCDQFWKNQT